MLVNWLNFELMIGMIVLLYINWFDCVRVHANSQTLMDLH